MPSATHRRRPRLGRWLATSADRRALTLLVLAPFLIYLAPLLDGRIELPGDDLNQNFPLRVLSGALLRSGHLPLWDPYLWSGTPLLAGWNAGALYPGTFLFAFLPAPLAWSCNLASAYSIAAAGLFLVARRLRASTLAAAVAALVFTYTGFMSGQVVHLGLVQGTAFLPFIVLAIDGLVRAVSRRALCANLLLLGASLALTVLAGDPRALSSNVIVGALCAVGFLRAQRGRRLALTARLVAGSALGAALSAIQWLPGLAFLANSQRSSAAYAFFSAGSVSIAHLGVQMLVPFLLGGNGNFGLRVYAGSFNLPELTFGCGLVALCAALAYLVPLAQRAREHLQRAPRRVEPRHLGTWYLVGVVGVLLTLGTTTPLGHLLAHLPFFGGERLQNRNAVIFEFPLALLVAFFIDDLGDSGSELRAVLRGATRLALLLPTIGVLALTTLAAAVPSGLGSAFELPAATPQFFDEERPYLLVTVVLALAVGGGVFVAIRLGGRRARRLLALLALAEVLLYVANATYTLVPTNVLTRTTALSGAVHASARGGRVALFNPLFETPAGAPWALQEVGVTDLNVIQQQPSVQGYGSIVTGTYENLTDTHYLENLNLGALSTTVFDALDLRSLLSLPAYFAEQLPIGAPIPRELANGTDVMAPSDPPLPVDATGPWYLSASKPATFVLPVASALRSATVLLGGAELPTTISVTLFGPTGSQVERAVAVQSGRARVNLGGYKSVFLRLRDDSTTPTLVEAVVAVTADPGRRLLLNGQIQGALQPESWRYGGEIGPFSMWRNLDASGPAWLQSPSSTSLSPTPPSPSPGSITILGSPDEVPQQLEVRTPRAALLVRSESFTSGWTARLTRAGGGPATVLPVHSIGSGASAGLLQSVELPAGDWRVTWRYAPGSGLLGLLLSLLGALAALWVAALALRRHSASSTRGRPQGERARPEQDVYQSGAVGSVGELPLPTEGFR